MWAHWLNPWTSTMAGRVSGAAAVAARAGVPTLTRVAPTARTIITAAPRHWARRAGECRTPAAAAAGSGWTPGPGLGPAAVGDIRVLRMLSPLGDGAVPRPTASWAR